MMSECRFDGVIETMEFKNLTDQVEQVEQVEQVAQGYHRDGACVDLICDDVARN